MAKWSQEELEKEIAERGWYKDQKQITNGIQYHLIDGTPVNFYGTTGTVLVQGKDTPIKREAEALFKGEPVVLAMLKLLLRLFLQHRKS